MNTIDNIKQMILEDSHRWQCPKYSGVVVVPEDLVEETFDYLKGFTVGEDNMLVQRKLLRFEAGGQLWVTSAKAPAPFEMEHCAAEYTTVMVNKWCLCHQRVGYIMTRLRTQSEHPSKFVMM